MVEKKPGVAAIFDLDGTLMPLPSLERRFLQTLRYREEIPVKNYWLWLREAARLAPHGISAVTYANKMYLQGLPCFDFLDESERAKSTDSPGHESGHQGQGQASFSSPRRNPRLPVHTFFSAAFQIALWHARQGHAVVLVSGTLEPLAVTAAKGLAAGLQVLGAAARVHVCATQLEETQGRWTGRILGEAMFGKAKACAAKRIASEMNLDLSKCYAYGDGAKDRWLLETVGKPVAVNPSRKLARIARKRSWPVLLWKEAKSRTQRHSQHGEREERKQEPQANGLLLREDLRDIRERVLQAVRWI